MKKILFGLSVFFVTSLSAQNYPDYYPTNNSNNGYYGEYDDEYYFPDDYYYEYPSDYYSNNFYESYYNDYQRSIYDVNWNRLISTYRLAPWQIQQIQMLNDRFPSYSSWNSYYRYNPDRWYYDRFYELERILGPQVFVVFQNNYYNGYSPVIYWQNYRRQHYVTHVYVISRYRNINVNRYRIDKTQYHQNNPRNNFGFRDSPRTGNGNWNNNPRADGFRNDKNTSNNGVRRQNNIRTETNAPKSDGFRNPAPTKKIESNSGGFRNQTPSKVNPNNSTRSSGQRFTSR